MAAELEDADLKPELAKIEGNDDEIKDRFAVALKFGTAGLRGVLGAGTNRMNICLLYTSLNEIKASGTVSPGAFLRHLAGFCCIMWKTVELWQEIWYTTVSYTHLDVYKRQRYRPIQLNMMEVMTSLMLK